MWPCFIQSYEFCEGADCVHQPVARKCVFLMQYAFVTQAALRYNGFRARTLRAAAAAPPLQSTESRLLCGVGLQSDMGVCSDVNAVTLSLPFSLHFRHIVMRCKNPGVFWSTQELMLYNLTQMVMSFSLHFPPVSLSVNFHLAT